MDSRRTQYEASRRFADSRQAQLGVGDDVDVDVPPGCCQARSLAPAGGAPAYAHNRQRPGVAEQQLVGHLFSGKVLRYGVRSWYFGCLADTPSPAGRMEASALEAGKPGQPASCQARQCKAAKMTQGYSVPT